MSREERMKMQRLKVRKNTDLQNQRGRPGNQWRPQRPGLSSLGSGAEPDRQLVAATIDELLGTL